MRNEEMGVASFSNEGRGARRNDPNGAAWQ
jgi:hypothetical protein